MAEFKCVVATFSPCLLGVGSWHASIHVVSFACGSGIPPKSFVFGHELFRQSRVSNLSHDFNFFAILYRHAYDSRWQRVYVCPTFCSLGLWICGTLLWLSLILRNAIYGNAIYVYIYCPDMIVDMRQKGVPKSINRRRKSKRPEHVE